MGQVVFKLNEVLGRHRIKQAELARRAGIRPAAVHALYHGNRARVDMRHIAGILDALEELTGEKLTVGDLLEYRRATPAPAVKVTVGGLG